MYSALEVAVVDKQLSVTLQTIQARIRHIGYIIVAMILHYIPKDQLTVSLGLCQTWS
jgi:hypothetical protein